MSWSVDLADIRAGTASRYTATPRCGEDFCDSCSDCLHCYGPDYCPDGGHRWVVYSEQQDAWRAKHPEAEFIRHLEAKGHQP